MVGGDGQGRMVGGDGQGRLRKQYVCEGNATCMASRRTWACRDSPWLLISITVHIIPVCSYYHFLHTTLSWGRTLTSTAPSSSTS